MTDRPIPFSKPMILALLDGRKTQTRRIMKIRGGGKVPDIEDGFQSSKRFAVGDKLWVKEALRPHAIGLELAAAIGFGDAPPERVDMSRNDLVIIYDADRKGALEAVGLDLPWLWKTRYLAGRFMPRRFSRLTLLVTDVRVQRLHDISEEDAIAEGVEDPSTEREERDFSICSQCGGTRLYNGLGQNLGVMPDCDCFDCDTHKKRYGHLWRHLHGPDSWDANPFVVAVSFSVHKCNIDAIERP